MGWLTLVFSSPIESYKVNEDSTVSFCYCGIARRVRVQGDFLYVGENSSRYRDNRIRSVKMQLQSDGCFHATIRPLQTETYTYSFRVNGKHKTDPFNRDTVWQMTDKWSIVSLGGTPQTDLYLPSKVKGQLIQTKWYDREEQLNRRVNIYLPAAYVEEMTNSSSTRQFPVLYLLHGINGYEGSWTERGRAIQIIENLIDQGQIEPLIVVMPDCNTGIHEDRPSHHTLWNNVWHYNRLCHDHNLEIALEDLMQHIDTTYRVSDQRSIAGLSSGARIAANIVNRYPDTFQYVGLFSPVVYKEQLPKQPIDTIGQDTSSFTTSYHIYMGKDDMFINNGRRFHQRLTKRNFPHTYTETNGSHTWRNWRVYLTDFLLQIQK